MNGMADNEDGDSFFDDDFPEISDQELERLEQDAITFTQQEQLQYKPTIARGPSDQINHSRAQRTSTPVAPQNRVQNGRPIRKGAEGFNAPGSRTSVDNSEHDSSDAMVLDEDGLPLVVEECPHVGNPQRSVDETTKREQWRLNRFAQSQVQPLKQHSIPQVAIRDSDVATRQQVPVSKSDYLIGTSHRLRDATDDTLRAKIAELMREKDQLTTALHEVKEEVFVRRGEAANIRARQSNEEKNHQKQLATLQKLKQDEIDKFQASIQAVNAENAKAASEIQFLKQDLQEEIRKAQAYQRQLREQVLVDKPSHINTTPKRRHALRDGFDDDEMMVVSPVKSGRRSKPGTPTANRKRKQPGGPENDVRALPLRLSGTEKQHDVSSVVPNAKVEQQTFIVRQDRTTQRHLKLIQSVINLKPTGSDDILIERLFKLYFPTNSNENVGCMVLDSIARLEGQRLPGDLTQIFIRLWAKAIEDESYDCLTLLLEAIGHIFDEDPFVVDVGLLTHLLPILQKTVEINCVPRFILAKKDCVIKPVINPKVDTTLCLELLYKTACLAADDFELISFFWRSLSTDFVLMTLNAGQIIPDITIMIRVLATSILPDTFGNICTADQQHRYSTHTCDRVLHLLWQRPKGDEGSPPYSLEEICLLRQECLDFLIQLTLGSSSDPFDPSSADNHGTIFLVDHASAIARLVRCACDELAAAYRMTPTQKLHIQLVNLAVRIVHFVLYSPAGRQGPWQPKIGSMTGSAQKFRVVMTRLTYAEGTDPGIDAGITEDTTRMATELLADFVTPDEVEDLVKVFEGDGEASNRRTSALGSTQR